MFYRLFLLIFCILFNFSFGEIYAHKTPNEKEQLRSLRQKKLVIAILDEPFYNLSYPNIPSLNSISEKFLKDYLSLDVTFKTISYLELEQELKNKTIDGVALIPKNKLYGKYLDFTESIFSEEIYVISQNEKINSIGDLDDKIIYSPHLKAYQHILNSILGNNDIHATLIGVPS